MNFISRSKKNEVTSYYYYSDYYWVVGRAEASYDVEKHSITVGKIVETVHKSSDKTAIVIGDDLKGKGIAQDKKEIIPVSEITNGGFTINCDKYVKVNKISAFDFPENYILSPEDAYCNRAYDFDGKLTHVELKVTKVE